MPAKRSSGAIVGGWLLVIEYCFGGEREKIRSGNFFFFAHGHANTGLALCGFLGAAGLGLPGEAVSDIL